MTRVKVIALDHGGYAVTFRVPQARTPCGTRQALVAARAAARVAAGGIT